MNAFALRTLLVFGVVFAGATTTWRVWTDVVDPHLGTVADHAPIVTGPAGIASDAGPTSTTATPPTRFEAPPRMVAS